MEVHYVYIIHSISLDKFYKRYSLDPRKRLEQHNNDESRYTKGKGPWKLVFVQSFPTKKEALIRERKLKKYSKKQIHQLLKSPKNEL